MLNLHTHKGRSLQARIVSGSIVLLSGSTLATIINLAYNVAVARFLGPKSFGHATVVYTLLTLISSVTLSFQIVTAKVVAQQPSDDARSAAYRHLHRGSWVCGIFVAILVLIFRAGITAYLRLPDRLLVEILAIGAAFYVPLGTRRGYIQGAFGFTRLAANLLVEGSVRLFGSLLLVMAGMGVTGVIIANSAGMAVAWLVIAPRLTTRSSDSLRLRTALTELTQALVFFSGQVLINNSSIVLVKHYFLPFEAGLFAAVAMVGRVIFTLSSAVVNSMFPVVAGTSAEERRNVNLLATSLLLVFGVGSVLSLGLRLLPAAVWTTLLGSGFATPGHHSLSLLLSLFAFSTVIYSLSVVIITYEMSYKIAHASWVQLAFSGILVAAICRYHSSLEEVILVQMILMFALLLVVGVPFTVDALRNSRSGRCSSPIRLIRRVSEDEVIAGFLRSDFEHAAYRDYRESLGPVVLNPNLDSPAECARRRALLFLRHRSLWQELPSDTEWYEAEVHEANLPQIRVFPRAHWRKLAQGSFAITNVIERIRAGNTRLDQAFTGKLSCLRERLSTDSNLPGSVLLIGIAEDEPFTVIDGNHRFVAALLDGKIDRLHFLCGLSPQMTRCCWYRTNPLTLTRYAKNALRHLTNQPDAELARLFEHPG